MTAQLKTGPIRLAVLRTDGVTKDKTLYLPAPDRGFPKLEFVKKSSTVDLETGDERTRLLGFLPVLTCRWTAYDERSGHGYTIGTADGNRPGYADLLVVLSGATKTLKVSPGPSTVGGFVVDRVDIKELGVAGPDLLMGLEVTFRGRDILSTMALGSW